ncbi:hypothetical protein XENTR_v10006100 [Xenopus tropicalis]|nr:hypothetical protein XENTR_v10006100 [Xenopus tropicalis]
MSVDCINSLGQTPLFIAALLGLSKMVDLLLRYGSNPNHRCYDWSTPVHAAAFSGNQWSLSMLIDAGGDLRLHDQDCRNPYFWALLAGKKNNAQMIEFIERCTAHMQALIQCFPHKALRKVDSSSILIHNPSLIDLISQGSAEKPLIKYCKYGGILTNAISSFGYGKLYFTNDNHLSCMAYIPYIEERDLVQGHDKPVFSFSTGHYMTMTNLMWGYTEVTVKELMSTHQNCGKLHFADLLIAEQEYMSKLHHPHILQLLAVCLSHDLEKTCLVFERVMFGTLYSILHERRTEFPVLHMETILNILLQVIDALIFVHWRGFIHCSFSSHAINIILPGLAKLSNFEFMAESKDGKVRTDVSHFPIPKYLYRWSAPEVILGKTISTKSDLFSFCVVMQESLTDTLPWDGLDCFAVKNAVISGHNLAVDLRIAKPYDKIVSTGIQAMAKDRTMSLQDIRWKLRKDIEESRKSASETLDIECHNRYPDVTNLFHPRGTLNKEPHNLQTDTLDNDKTFSEEVTEIRCKCGPVLTCHLNSENLNKQALHTETHHSGLVCDSAHEFQNKDTISGAEVNAFYEMKYLDYQLDNERTKPDMFKNTYNMESCAEEKHVISCSVSPKRSAETDSESNTEEINSLCEITDTAEDNQITDKARRPSSLQKHIRSTTEKLKISQTLLEKINKALDSVEKSLKKSDNTHVQTYKKLSEECVSCKASDEISRDEVDYMNGQLKIKSNTVRSALGPPSQYKPPRLDHMYTQRDKKNFQSEYAMGARLKTVKKQLSWKDYCSHQTSSNGREENCNKAHRKYAEKDKDLKDSNTEPNDRCSEAYSEELFYAKANVCEGRTKYVGRTIGMASSEWTSTRLQSPQPCIARNPTKECGTASDILSNDFNIGLDNSSICPGDEFFTANFELSCCSNDQYPGLESLKIREEINLTQSASNLILCPSGSYKQAESGSDQLEMTAVEVNTLSFIHHTSSVVDIQELSTVQLPISKAGKVSTRFSTPVAGKVAPIAVLDSSALDAAENNATQNNYKKNNFKNKVFNEWTISSDADTDRAHSTLDDALERIMHLQAMETDVTDGMSKLDQDGPQE